MTLQEIVTEVVSITKRPDKTADIVRSVNQVARLCSHGAFFDKDLVEDILALDPQQYAQKVSLAELERFRKFSYIRPEGSKCYLEERSPDRIFEQGKELLDRYYVAGTQLVLKLSRLTSVLYIGYYQYPPVLTLNGAATYWMLEEEPYMLIDGAAARIFRNVGDEKSAQEHEGSFRLAYDVMRRDRSNV